jgi:tetratricopeptide (TPR) repeat protein
MGAAANLLRRAHGLLPERDAARLELLPDLAEAMTEIGEFAWAEVFLDEAAEAANELGDAALSAHATLGRLLVGRFGDDAAWGDQVVPAAEEAIAVLEQSDDHVGLAKAYRLLCLAHGTAGRFQEFMAAGERDLHHSTLAGDRRGQMRAVTAGAIAANYGPEPVPSAIAQCEESLALAAGNRRSEAIVMSYLAELEALNGNFANARELCSKARAMLEDAGAGVHASSISTFSGPVELVAGDPAGAEVELRRDYEALAQMGETYFASTIAALLAEALYRLGRLDEAESFTRKAEELASEDDVWTESVWRCVRAKVLVRDAGTAGQAISLTREAIEILQTADAPVWLANGLCDSAEVFEASGDPAEAKALLAQALALYERKQARVPAEGVRMRLAGTDTAAAAAVSVLR